MLKEEHKILVPFIREPWKGFTFESISGYTKKRSYSYVYNTIKRYVGQEILFEEHVGNSILYFLNIGAPKTQSFSGMIAEYTAWGAGHIPSKMLSKVCRELGRHMAVVLLTGSYAKGTQTKESDVDIVVICSDCEEPRMVLSAIQQACELAIPPGHPYVFKRGDFLSMITNNKANYGKEIVKNNLLLSGGGHYYMIISEAMSSGLNDKKLH